MRAAVLALVLAAVLALPAAAAAPAFDAVLRAPGHSPVVDDGWPYVVAVTDARGRPLRAAVHVQITYGGLPVGQVQRRVIEGVWTEPLQWPSDAVGQALTLEARVTVAGRTRRLEWAVTTRAGRKPAPPRAGTIARASGARRAIAAGWFLRPRALTVRIAAAGAVDARWQVTCNKGESAVVATSGRLTRAGTSRLRLPPYTRQECAAAVLATTARGAVTATVAAR
jgi:hypothetical protein